MTQQLYFSSCCSHLLGICLIVSGDTGTRTLYRYPSTSSDSYTPGGMNTTTNATSTTVSGNANNNSHTTNVTEEQEEECDIPPSLRDSVSSHNAGSNSRLPTSLSFKFSPPTVSLDTTRNNYNTQQQQIHTQTQHTHIRKHAAHSSNTITDLTDVSDNVVSVSSVSHSSLDHEYIYGMSSDEFARVFYPQKTKLNQQLLDVTIEEYRFLSFPIRLSYKNTKSRILTRRLKRAQQRLQTRQHTNVTRQEKAHIFQFFMKQHIQNNREERKEKDNDDDDDDDDADAASVASSSSIPLSVSADECMYDSELDDSSMDGVEHELTYFNVVFVLNSSIPHPLCQLYGRIVQQFSISLLHEQIRDDFMSKQAHYMLQMREKYFSNTNKTKATSSASSTVNNISLNYQSLYDQLLTHSLLAQHIHHLYHGLIQQEYVQYVLGSATVDLKALQQRMDANIRLLQLTPLQHNTLLQHLHNMAKYHHTNIHIHTSTTDATRPATMHSSSTHALQIQDGIDECNKNDMYTHACMSDASIDDRMREMAHTLLSRDHSHTTIVINNWLNVQFTLNNDHSIPTFIHDMYIIYTHIIDRMHVRCCC